MEFWNVLIVDMCKTLLFGIYELAILFGNPGQQYRVLLLFSSATAFIIQLFPVSVKKISI
jgi:hypothetical protein